MSKCEICGAERTLEECQVCRGSGDSPDPDVRNGRYYYPACEPCGGTGMWEVCPNGRDEQHIAAYDRLLLEGASE